MALPLWEMESLVEIFLVLHLDTHAYTYTLKTHDSWVLLE